MDRNPIRETSPIIPYCATCDFVGEPDAKRRFGQRFLCPNSEQDARRHIASFVKGDAGKFWLRRERFLIEYEYLMIGVARFIQGKVKLRLPTAPVILFLRLLVLVGLTVLAMWNFAGAIVASLGGFALVFDILVPATSVAFISRNPTHPLRTILYSLLAFLQLALAFAVIYLACGRAFRIGETEGRLSPFDAAYFSVVTVVTLGYGDIAPVEWHSRAVVIVEVMTGLYFLSVLLTTFASWTANLPGDEPLPTYDALTKE